MFSLDGRIAIVTGGAKGIGKSIVLALSKVGAITVIADIDALSGQELERNLKQKGLKAEFMQVDVSESESVNKMIDEVVEKYGKIDILVNNAGILHDAQITDIDDATWDRVIKVNLTGVFYCCRAVVPHMIRQKYGKIINIASAGGKLGFPFAGVDYCATKGGIMALTRQLALQISKYGINVNAVAPGTTETELIKDRSEDQKRYIISRIPVGRMGRPEDTAAAVVFLASSGSDYITGETIDVNGGLYMD
ncbi:SDR family NAD(P)-dependent oxidoreductase [Thermoanaerobacterium sp. DL9XJH110]|uniref:SDR family NAD(P)-dependent oxidoreductase n=1 Tax=Thermoanaerobacterium sp. DL9XJH110 TaxID=3386643 RepID=UPI003BB7FBC2